MNEQGPKKVDNETLLERIVDHFTERLRNGLNPSIEKYQAKYPELRDEIQELLSSVAMIEELKQQTPASGNTLERNLKEVINLNRIGDYRIVRELGRGGMGIVFEAVHESLGRRVAIKVLPGRSLDDTKGLERFRREAQAAANLHHTNIVSVFGVGDHDGYNYYVMEFIEGQPLNDVLLSLREGTPNTTQTERETRAEPANSTAKEFGATIAHVTDLQKSTSIKLNESVKLNESANQDSPHEEPRESADSNESATSNEPAKTLLEQSSSTIVTANLPIGKQRYRWAAKICSQVADALSYAHGQGTLHRDLKPANLILDEDGVVWLTDFGLVKNLSNQTMTKTGDIIGTPQYMAPESFEGKYDQRSETYCLGLTLYELSTLNPAFANASTPELIKAVMTQTPVVPRRMDGNLPEDLNTIIQKAISREPENRYQSARELRNDLRAFLDDRPIQARRSSAFEQAVRWGRRNPVIASLSALSILLLIATAATASVGYMVTKAQSEQLSQLLYDAEWNEALLAYEKNEAEIARQYAEDNLEFAEIQKDLAEENLQLTLNAFNEKFNAILSNVGSGGVDLNLIGLEEMSGIESVVTVEDAAVLDSLVEIYQEIVSKKSSNTTEAKLYTADASRRVANAYHLVNKHKEAQIAYGDAIRDYKAVLQKDRASVEHTVSLVRTRSELAISLRRSAPLQMYDELHRAKKVLESHPNPDNRQIQFELAKVLNLLAFPRPTSTATAESTRKIVPERIKEVQRNQIAQAIEIMDRLTLEDSANPDYKLMRGKCYRNLAALLISEGKNDEGGKALRKAVVELENLTKEFPDTTRFQYLMALTYKTSFDLNAKTEANSLQRAFEITANLTAENPANYEYKQLDVICRIALAKIALTEGDKEKADSLIQPAEQMAIAIMQYTVSSRIHSFGAMREYMMEIGEVLREISPERARDFQYEIQRTRRSRPPERGDRFRRGRFGR